MKIMVIVLFIIVYLNGYSIASEGQNNWPAVCYREDNINFSLSRLDKTKFKIFGCDGSPLYELECHLGPYEGDPAFDYSGDFECRLSSLYSVESHSTLLTEENHQTRDWESRGRFLLWQLLEDCALYPEYGKLRHFRLRGMNLTLEVTDIELSKKVVGVPMIGKLDLHIIVEPDPTATSPITEKIEYLEPPRIHPKVHGDLTRDCSNVYKNEIHGK